MLATLRRHAGVFAEALRQDRVLARTAVPRDETAFLPGALEILETPPSPLGRGLLWSIFAFVALALAWSILGSVDVVATASGQVIPRGRVRVIQPADYGVIRAIHVSEGQVVRAGQPLLDLDPTVSGADVAQARQALLTAEIDRARAQALVNHARGRPARFDVPAGSSSQVMATQQALIEAKVNELEAALAGLRQEEVQRRGDIAMVEAEVAKLGQQLPLAEEQLSGLRTLSAKGYAGRLRVAEVEERVVGVRSDLAIRRSEARKAVAAFGAVGQQMAKLRSEYAREALDALTEAQATRDLRAEELIKASQRASQTVLKAPEAGTIERLQINTIGGVVKPGDQLMNLIPWNGELIVEAMLPNREVGFVQKGQQVEIKFAAFPFTRYGTVKGSIEKVSSDAIKDDAQGLVFPTRVRFAQSWIQVGAKRVPLTPGMAVTAEIQTGRRRIIDYLISPIGRRFEESGHER